MSKRIVLFDMDGTLTESRQPFLHKPLRNALEQLVDYETEIGIITGSDEDYLQEQMGQFLSQSSSRYKIHLLPCNGTKYFKPPETAQQSHLLTSEVSMKEFLGTKNYRALIQELIYSQVDMANSGVPLTGHFINCRGSMINWCPIGRNASSEDREEFKILDQEQGLRDRVLKELKAIFEIKDLQNKLVVKLGGDTSFDIYPRGWDKTYGLKHFPSWDTWFVGDRCDENGNDYEIYQECLGQSYVTSGPENTVEIIECIIKHLRKK